MMKLIAISIALLSASTALQAQVTSNLSGTNIKSSDIATTVVVSAEERAAFRGSLAAGNVSADLSGSFPTVTLHWGSLRGASSYRVLRSGSFTGPAASIALPEKGTQEYVAQVLPGYEFYFRVVALDGKGIAIDSTAAVHVKVTPLRLDPTGQMAMPDHNSVIDMNVSCKTPQAQSVIASWTPRSDVGSYSVEITTRPRTNTAPLVSTTVTGSTFSQNGIPAGMYELTVKGYYVMSDYPAPGQSTNVQVLRGSRQLTFPSTPNGPCN